MTNVLQFPTGQELPVEEVTPSMALDSVTLAPRSSGEGQGVATLPPPPAHLSSQEQEERDEIGDLLAPVYDRLRASMDALVHSDDLVIDENLSELVKPKMKLWDEP